MLRNEAMSFNKIICPPSSRFHFATTAVRQGLVEAMLANVIDDFGVEPLVECIAAGGDGLPYLGGGDVALRSVNHVHGGGKRCFVDGVARASEDEHFVAVE